MTISIVDMDGLLCTQNKRHTKLHWWCHPRRLSRRIKRLIRGHPGGVEAGLRDYALWCLLVSEITEREPRDLLVDSDGNDIPLSDLADEWRVGLPVVEAFLSRCAQPEVGLLQGVTPTVDGPSTNGRPLVELEKKREEEKREEEKAVTGVTADRFDVPTWFAEQWNEIAGKVLPRIESVTKRKSKMLAFWKDAGKNEELVRRAIAAFASWDFALEKRLTVDTLLVAEKRDKYLEWGRNGPPKKASTGGVSENVARRYLERRFGNAGNVDR